MSLSMFREAVAEASARLKAGENPHEVPCPKCSQPRCIAVQVYGHADKPFESAYCSICSFHWVIP